MREIESFAMRLHRLGTRFLGLFTRSHQCANGPMAGEKLQLSENSPNTAWLEVRGQVGRYMADRSGALVWQPKQGGE